MALVKMINMQINRLSKIRDMALKNLTSHPFNFFPGPLPPSFYCRGPESIGILVILETLAP